MRILIIKPGAIGDLLQMTPVFRALKEKFPVCRITLMTGSSMTASMFQHFRSVDDLLVFERKGKHRTFAALLGLWREIRSRKFDLVLNFQRSNLKAWLLVTAAFPCRLLVYLKDKRRGVHAVVNHLATMAPLGIDASDTALEFQAGPEAEQYADNLFTAERLTDKNVIALNPGASHPVNRWSPERFALLADLLAKRTDCPVIIIGGSGDESLARELVQHSTTRPLNLTGKTDLLQLGAVLKRCTLLVTGDTGPMHMATAVNTRVVALFGAADPSRTGPLGSGHRVIRAEEIDCVPCRSRRCRSSNYLECMERITPEQVFREIKEMLSEMEKKQCAS